MATVTLSRSFDFSAPQDWDWQTTAATPTNISITNGTYQQTFNGSFTYSDAGVVSGTVTASSFLSNGSLIYSVTGMTSNATVLQNFVDNAGDTAQTYAFVLQGNDIIKGSSGNDVLLGYGGDDTLYGNGGNDTIDGGTGNNTVVFAGNYAAATITYSAATGKFTVVTASGTDIVSNVQTLTFADKSVVASSLIASTGTPSASDDYAASTATTGRVAIGGSVNGTIETAGDKDWFAVTLVANSSYSFSLNAASTGGLPDPYLKLYSGTGAFLASNDDAGQGLNSLLPYTATTSGTYYLEALSSNFTSNTVLTGKYVLTAQLTASSLDLVPPTISSFSPAVGATGVAVDSNIVLTFSEAIQRGSGLIQLRTADGSLIESFDIATSSRVTISGSTLTIDPTQPLTNGAHYGVSLPAGFVRDLAGNAYIANGAYNFDTATTSTSTIGSGITSFELVSASPAGAAAHSVDGGFSVVDSVGSLAVSSDGRFVAFASNGGNLVAGDQDPAAAQAYFAFDDSFVKDMTGKGISFLVTDSSGNRIQDPAGFTENAFFATYPWAHVSGSQYSMSADGRYVAFVTISSALVDRALANPAAGTGYTSGDINDQYDVYLKDRSTGAITLISSDINGLSDPDHSKSYQATQPVVSADGHLVAFTSGRPDLVSGDSNIASDIFVKDVTSGAIRLISTSAAGLEGDGPSYDPAFSADGKYVVFASFADNLVAGDTNHLEDIFRKNLSTGAIDLVSSTSAGGLGGGASYVTSAPVISADGRYVAFTSSSPNLVAGDNNNNTDVFYKDMVTGQIKILSTTKEGAQLTGFSQFVSMSDDGRYVVFSSGGLPGDTTGAANGMFIKDTSTGDLQPLLLSELGHLVPSFNGKISADGKYIILASNYLVDDPSDSSGILYNSSDQVFRVANPFLTASNPGGGTSSQSSTASQAISSFAAGSLAAAVSVTDSASQIVANLDGLQSVAAVGKLTSIALTDSGFPTLSITPTQLTSDAAALKVLTGNFTVMESATGANLSFGGLAGHANTVVFSGMAAQYSVAATGDGSSFTVTDTGTGRSSVDHLSNIAALQFSDHTEIVAQAPNNGTVTTGNITELYGAVFGRLPDVAGLAFYQQVLANSPATPLTTFAQYFLASPEYTGNSAHAYAQTSAGDAQFITDSYNNLLHRAPEAGAVPYYQAVIAQLTAGQTQGTAGYTSALAIAHATVLAYFSQSPEFVGDVQITAQHAADATHWLMLI